MTPQHPRGAGDDGHDHAGPDHAAHDDAAHDHVAHDHAAHGGADLGPDLDHAGAHAPRRAAAHNHGHGHGHSHSHSLSTSAGARHEPRLRMAFALIVAFLVVQVVVALLTGSLALLSDAGHMATDALGMGMALAAIRLASRGSRDGRRTFGWYRLEILAALANAVLLLGVAAYVVFVAIVRLTGPPEVDAAPVFIVGLIGLAVNLAAFALLREGAAESLNVRGAYLEVIADTLGSVGVIIGAVALWLVGWAFVDALVGAAIGLFIAPRAWRLGRDALRVLTQAAPVGVDLDAIRADLGAIAGVVDVHDLHVWTLTSDMDVLTAHVMVTEGTDSHSVLDQARHVLADRHQLAHATLQVEPENHTGCAEVTW